MTFVHLHRHSEWSLGDGTGTAEMYAEQAALLGQPALAITDHGSLAGTLYHAQACEKVGIKPIMGMEAYFRPDIDADREEKKQYGFFHLVLLAKNKTGWQNLMKISSQSHDDYHYYQKPSVDWKLLREHGEGLIATSSCLAGFIPQLIMNQEFDLVDEHLENMQSVFGDNFFFEIQPHDIPEQRVVNEYTVNLAKTKGIPFVATSDVHSPYEDWTDTQNIRVMISYNKTVNDKQENEDKEYGGIPTTFLMSAEEIQDCFDDYHSTLTESDIDSAIKQSIEIADMCDAIIFDKSPKVPKTTGSALESERILREWCEEGLVRIGKEDVEIYRDRLEEELAVMKKLKVLDYFVFVGDMVRWAKDQGIRVGPGRGSAGGSLVCYLSRITALDPIGYELLFERFLNEYRTEIPDIDIDFQPDRRHEIKEYLAEKWGEDHVIDVAAFQSFGLKAAVKDVARTLGVSFEKTKRATDLIPKLAFGETLETLETKIPKLKDYFEEFPEVRKHAIRLQGQIKGASKHAAAVIVTNEPAENLLPLMRAKDGTTVTQWSERANGALLSPYGFLKVDMLVTAALSAQARSIQLIKERHGIELDFEDPHMFPVVESPLFSDIKVVERFGERRNLGVFQFASEGISGLLKEIRPENLDHVIAANALYRPGPLDYMMDYAKRKNGKQEWSLPHPVVEPFLKKTFGIIVFQEQVMQMYKALAKDVDSSESAVFLKVVAKGIARDLTGKQKLQAYYEKFQAGCEEKGIPKPAYDALWDQILDMTTYSFNRSHSAGYALQAYIDWYLKSYYPIEFYEPLLASEPKKTQQIVREGKYFGMQILPPDINLSGKTFTIVGDSIRCGLMSVSGVADAGFKEIEEKRPFSSYEDFVSRVAARKVNSTARQNLIDGGAFDSLGERRGIDVKYKRLLEKRTLGVAVTPDGNDASQYETLVLENADSTDDLESIQNEHGSVVVGGEITRVTEHTTKRGSLYLRVNIDNPGGEIQTVFWQNEKYADILHEGDVVFVAGSYNEDYGSVDATHCITAQELQEKLKEN